MTPERIDSMEIRLQKVEGCLDEVGDAVLGTRRSDFAGGGRNEDGLIHTAASTASAVEDISTRLAQVEGHISNGGLRVKLHPAVLTFLGVVGAALIGGVAAVAAALIGG